MKNSSFLMLFSGIFVLAVVGIVFAGPTTDKKTLFTDQQKTEIQNVVKEYLIQNPEVLMEVSRALQEKTRRLQQEQAVEAISSSFDQFQNTSSPILGNPEGNIALVKFLDYQCGHCKTMEPIVNQLIKDNPNLKVIIKELPVFGANSEFAARVALAAANQGKFLEMHNALLKETKKLSNDTVLEIAKQKGLNIEKLKADLDQPVVGDEMIAVRELAAKMGIQGTPYFIVLDVENGDGTSAQISPGAASKADLQKMIDELNQ